MLTFFLAAGVLEGQSEQPLVGGFGERGGGRFRTAKKKIVDEAKESVVEVLETFDPQERVKYLERLDRLTQVPPKIDDQAIREAAAMAVAALMAEIEAEFDAYVTRLAFERDEDDALIAILLA